ncbi:helix-turn-helix domain-containing protein [Allomuricauda sp. CP2A]|uniref:helix-turn-helix domain-containing protein n=1 Tax=Allomuricauda sp. CP2A TaxID=1848189 RepID=UPI00083319C7|nr:helix-turn-helix transcriptional regulator [Muricauda sp. CP2A]
MNTQNVTYLVKLGTRIKELREEKGVDQKSFAFDCGIGRTQLYMIENGKTNPRLTTLLKISEGLGISVSELLNLS